jgi:hypothetical protein
MTSTFIATVEDDALAGLKALEGVVLTEVQQDVVPSLISFLENAASGTITYLGGFLKKVVADITGASSSVAPAVPAAADPAGPTD